MEAKSGKIREEMFAWLFEEICEAERAGIPVAVDGVVYSISEGKKLHEVMENSYYMKSYVGDERGRIVRIDFDHIARL